MKKFVTITFLLLYIVTVHAQILQDPVFTLPDTARPFTLENFYQLVINYHPVAKQVRLLPDVARQEIRMARGNFDPKVETEFLLKHYNNTEYYRLFDGVIKFPTRSPISTAIGIERNTGTNLNPEHYISSQYDYRQLYAGITIPLGQGLFTDERRTALKQAELFGDMLEAEQIKTINKLLLDIAKEYWQWYYTYYNYRLASNTADIALDIFKRTKLNFEGGELAPIDTVQAKITYMERTINKYEAYLEFKNTTLKISTYLWDSLQNPVELTLQYAPVAESTLVLLTDHDLDELVNQAKTNHPEIRKLNLKIRQLELDKRLAAEYLKPKLNLSYYMLNQPLNPEGINGQVTLNDNYKFGADFSIPIFLRRERAKVAQTGLKIRTTEFDRDLRQREVINEIRAAHNELTINGIILQQQRAMAENYSRLMRAELLNIENGESDLFKINVQQEKLFSAQSKLIKIIAEYEKQKAVLYWSAGVRPLN